MINWSIAVNSLKRFTSTEHSQTHYADLLHYIAHNVSTEAQNQIHFNEIFSTKKGWIIHDNDNDDAVV